MPTITTTDDVAIFTGVTYSVAEIARLDVLIPIAERFVARWAGLMFYDATDVDGDASQDWLHVVSLVADRMLRNEDPALRSIGVFQSESFGGDYSYSLKAGGGVAINPGDDPTVGMIIALYRTTPMFGVSLSGPTREAPVVVDPDVSRGLYEPF